MTKMLQLTLELSNEQFYVLTRLASINQKSLDQYVTELVTTELHSRVNMLSGSDHPGRKLSAMVE